MNEALPVHTQILPNGAELPASVASIRKATRGRLSDSESEHDE